MSNFDLGCRDWRELALLLYAEVCNRCQVKLSSHDYKLCEKCPKAMTVKRLSEQGDRKKTQ